MPLSSKVLTDASGRRTYLAVFILPVAKLEHRGIIDVIKKASGGDYTTAFIGASRGSNCVGYLFRSHRLPWELSFSKVLMNDDSLLIVEVGEKFTHLNLGKAEAWLKSHRK